MQDDVSRLGAAHSYLQQLDERTKTEPLRGERNWSGPFRRFANVDLRLQTYGCPVVLHHFALELLHMICRHQGHRTATEAPTGHSGSVDACQLSGNTHHCVQFSTAHFKVVAKACVRFIHELSELNQVPI